MSDSAVAFSDLVKKFNESATNTEQPVSKWQQVMARRNRAKAELASRNLGINSPVWVIPFRVNDDLQIVAGDAIEVWGWKAVELIGDQTHRLASDVEISASRLKQHQREEDCRIRQADSDAKQGKSSPAQMAAAISAAINVPLERIMEIVTTPASQPGKTKEK